MLRMALAVGTLGRDIANIPAGRRFTDECLQRRREHVHAT